MFIAMSLILLVIGTVVGWFFNSMWYGLLIMLALSVLMMVYSYFFSKSSALRANRVRLVTQAEEPRLWKIVASVAEKAGCPMPEVGVTEDAFPNAFATGRSPKDAAVVATRGLLRMLPDDELEGVIAHEMSHVRNRDILVMSVAATMAAVISYLARMATWMALFSGGGDNRNNGAILVLAIILDVTLPIAAILVQLGVSRSREYLADETGARITGNPRALARALARIEGGPDADYDQPTYAPLWIKNPDSKKQSLTSRLFRTHPPTEDRIARLNRMADEMEGGRTSGYPVWE
ncbi:MAG: M48 family metalloprotease [Thermoplasmatales archaeon]|nr:M48 family metalloprotease [Thermoplasmatales archaeon]